MFLLFFQILGSLNQLAHFVLVTIIIFDLTLHICIYIYQSCGVFLATYGWFEGNILYFNTQICVYHILFTDGTTDWRWKNENVAAENFDGIDLILGWIFFWACAFGSFIAHLCIWRWKICQQNKQEYNISSYQFHLF